MEGCSKVLELFTADNLAIANKCNVFKATLIDRLVENFRNAFRDFFLEVLPSPTVH